MKNTLKTKNNLKNYGFTLLEVVIVVIVLAILAAIALPRYVGAIEKSRAAEGTYILGTILSSMERYYLENGVFPSAITDLDVPSITAKNFNPSLIAISPGCAPSPAFCAGITRNAGAYKLLIDRDGTITCSPGIGPQTCQDAGY